MRNNMLQKKSLLTASFVVLMAVAVIFGLNSTIEAGITGSAHDFSNKGWNSTSQTCVVCHTPHNADTTTTNAPLWNHEVSTAVYTVYSSPTLTATVSQPGGASKLCLSCHDGTVAIDSFGGTTGTTFVGGKKNLGTSLSNDHPISFTFDTALATADGGLFDPATTNSGLGSTIDADLLFAGKVECASCHDVHDAAGNADLLRVTNTASALCFTCHNK